MSTLATILKNEEAIWLVCQATSIGCPPDQLHNFLVGGYAPQPKQMQFHARARLCDEPGGPTQIGQGGGRGGSKSHAAVCQVALDDCRRRPGLKWLYLRSVGASARESFEDFLNKALPQMMPHYLVSRAKIELPNGSQILLGGFRDERDIDKYVGLEYDGILVDDAHLIGGGKYHKIRGSLRTSKPDWRPRLYATFNPGGIGHSYLKRLFVEPWRSGDETDTRFVFSLPEDNVFINTEYVGYLDGLTGWLKRAWRWGDFDISAGQFFTTWDHDTHVVEPFDVPASWTWWLAMDYGWTHYNVVQLFAEDGDGIVYVVDEHAERRQLVAQHAEAVRAMMKRWDVRPHWITQFVTGPDCFTPGSDGRTIADDWADHGFELIRADADRINGAAECLRRLGDPRNGIAPTLFIFNHCALLIETLPALEHDPNNPQKVCKVNVDEDGLGGDDAYDGLRYGLMTRAKVYGPPGVARYA